MLTKDSALGEEQEVLWETVRISTKIETSDTRDLSVWVEGSNMISARPVGELLIT